jgi:hypothetical protein
MPRYNLLAFTNAVPGREAEFNDWYTNVHLGDVLKLPGVRAAQRFCLSGIQHRAGPHPYEYMAVYEIDTDDLPATLARLREVSGTPDMPLSPALQDQRMVWIYEPITDRVGG